MLNPSTIDKYFRIWGLSLNDQSEVTSSGCNITEIANEYGTPLFIVNEDHLKTVCQRTIKSFRQYHSKVEIFYSYKTNTIPALLKKLHQEGIGAEVTTGYELWLALRQGISPDKIIFNGPCKTKKDLRIAIDEQIRMINIDSEQELTQLDEVVTQAGKNIAVGVRFGYPFGGNNHFGIRPSSIVQVFKKILNQKRLKPEGLHVHLGSNIRSGKTYIKLLKIGFQLIERLKDELNITIKVLNVGGGFGLPTTKTLSKLELSLLKLFNIPPSPPKLEDNNAIPSQVSLSFSHFLKNKNIKSLSLYVEPGRLLTGSSQILILKVVGVKNNGRRMKYVILDGGVYNCAFPLLYEYHECIAVNRIFEKPSHRYTLVGPTCTPSDILYRNKLLQNCERGDLIAIMDAGAYFVPLLTNFGFPKPAVVGLSGGNCRILQKQEDYNDMAGYRFS
jgi:diaminopimelate decarboxylase